MTIKFDIPKKQSAKVGINLFYNKNLKDHFSYIPPDFTITTRNGSYKFNFYMMRSTSETIEHNFRLRLNESIDFYKLEYNLQIEDGLNVMSKIERLYRGNQVSFSVCEILIVQKIIATLDLKCFPDYIINLKPNKNDDFDKYVLVIDEESFLKFLQNIPNKFQIKNTGKFKKNRYVNIFGVKSSGVIRRLIENDQQLNCYEYYLKDDCFFIDVCDYLNYNTIILTPSNYQSIKQIATDLEISSLCEEIDKWTNDYMFANQLINEHRTQINSISQLFEYLYNKNGLQIETIKDILEKSIWAHTEKNIIEFASCFVQVIYTNIRFHQFLFNLLVMLDKNSEGNNDFNLLIPFLSKNLLNDFGTNKLNCAFVYRLFLNGKISKDELTFAIKCNHRPKFKANNISVWFFPEINKWNLFSYNYLNTLDEDHKLFIQSYYPNNIEEFKKMRDSYEPDDELSKALIKDDVDKLQSIMKDRFFKQTTIPFNIFESFVENGKTNILNYSAACGSEKCFKYLIEQNKKLDSDTYKYAFFSQNTEIIEILKSKYGFLRYPFYARANHRNNFFDIFILKSENTCFPNLFQETLQNINLYSLIKIINNEYNVGYSNILKLLIFI